MGMATYGTGSLALATKAIIVIAKTLINAFICVPSVAYAAYHPVLL